MIPNLDLLFADIFGKELKYMVWVGVAVACMFLLEVLWLWWKR